MASLWTCIADEVDEFSHREGRIREYVNQFQCTLLQTICGDQKCIETCGWPHTNQRLWREGRRDSLTKTVDSFFPFPNTPIVKKEVSLSIGHVLLRALVVTYLLFPGLNDLRVRT
jgi:hypothetical protein